MATVEATGAQGTTSVSIDGEDVTKENLARVPSGLPFETPGGEDDDDDINRRSSLKVVGRNGKRITLMSFDPADPTNSENFQLVQTLTDADGDINLEHLMNAAKGKQADTKTIARQRKIIFGVLVLAVVLFGVTLATSVLGGSLIKEMHVSNGGRLVVAGGSVQNGTGSADAVSTTMELFKHPLSSRVPNKYLEELRSFTVELGTCDQEPSVLAGETCSATLVTVQVLSWKRVSQVDAHCGSVVEFDTSEGLFKLDDYDLYHAATGKSSSGIGFYALDENRDENSKGGRRLQSQHGRQLGRRLASQSLTGFFNKIEAAEFECSMGGIIGAVEKVEPPPRPRHPFFFTATYDGPCEQNKKNVCSSKLFPGIPLPGVTDHGSFKTVRHFEETLETPKMKVVVAEFATNPLAKQVTVFNYETRNVTKFVLWRDLKARLFCSVTRLRQADVEAKRNAKTHLAYLGRVNGPSEPTEQFRRWVTTPIVNGNLTDLHMEMWERLKDRTPARLFLRGTLDIEPGVLAGPVGLIPAAKLDNFAQNQTAKEVNEWIEEKTGLQSIAGSDGIASLDHITRECQEEEVGMSSSPADPQEVGTPATGPYDESIVQSIGDHLATLDPEEFAELLRASPRDWPASYETYWTQMARSSRVDQRTSSSRRLRQPEEPGEPLRMTSEMYNATRTTFKRVASQGRSDAVKLKDLGHMVQPHASELDRNRDGLVTSAELEDYGRRLFKMSVKFDLKKLGVDGAFNINIDHNGLIADLVAKKAPKPAFMKTLGLDFSITANLHLEFTKSKKEIRGELVLSLTKGLCVDVPEWVPLPFWTAGAAFGGRLYLKAKYGSGGGALTLGADIFVTGGLYKQDYGGSDNRRRGGRVACSCSTCNDMIWVTASKKQKDSCACKRPSHRRRGYDNSGYWKGWYSSYNAQSKWQSTIGISACVSLTGVISNICPGCSAKLNGVWLDVQVSVTIIIDIPLPSFSTQLVGPINGIFSLQSTDSATVHNKYYALSQGTCCCSTSDRIETSDECDKAVAALKLEKKSPWTGDYAMIPGGCSHKASGTSGTHWNKLTGPGTSRSDLTPVCKIKEV